MTIPTFTKSFTIRIVANNLSGSPISFNIRLSRDELLSPSSSRFSRDKEKKAISDPEAKAENKSNIIANAKATTALTDGGFTLTAGNENKNVCKKAGISISKSNKFICYQYQKGTFEGVVSVTDTPVPFEESISIDSARISVL